MENGRSSCKSMQGSEYIMCVAVTTKMLVLDTHTHTIVQYNATGVFLFVSPSQSASRCISSIDTRSRVTCMALVSPESLLKELKSTPPHKSNRKFNQCTTSIIYMCVRTRVSLIGDKLIVCCIQNILYVV